ncbi:MAG: 3D domain-containing protein, partial [Thermacetogeniaceae bacterium]
VTAYCPCYLCCGKTDGITSSGKPAQPHRTAATDPTVIPLGTLIYLEGIGTFVAEDTGSAIKGNRIDIFMDDHQKALEFGVKDTRAYILQEKL